MTQDQYASDLVACTLIEQCDDCDRSTALDNGDSTNTSIELIDERDQHVTDNNLMMKKCDKQHDLNQYFQGASDKESKTQNDSSDDHVSQNFIEKSLEDHIDVTFIDVIKLRDIRSSTVYSRSDSETSNVYRKSISRDSSSTCNESNMDVDGMRRIYDRTDSSNSFIQDEIDSEEYHHYHRYSMTSDTLEYIRGRDDWRLHTETKMNDLYRRQSSSISVREEIDSDEYHHDRLLSDVIEMAYLDTENTQSLPSLPSSFEDNKVFERYYLELEQIKDHLSSDIQQNIAKKQVVLLDSNEIQPSEGYLYPLPDIVLNQSDGQPYTIDIQLDSDYGNVTSESEDDIQSVIEVSLDRDGNYEREIIATLDMNNDVDEMIEVTLWDLKDDFIKDDASKESSVEIIGVPDEDAVNEHLSENDFEYMEAPDDAKFLKLDSSSISDDLNKSTNELIGIDYVSENIHSNITAENTVPDIKSNASAEEQSEKDATSSVSKSIESKQLIEFETGSILSQIPDQSGEKHLSTSNLSQSFINREIASSTSESTRTHVTVSERKKKKKKAINENVDDLIKEGSMGVWFHN